MHGVNSVMCYFGGGNENTWHFLRLYGISLWVKKDHINWGFMQEVLLKKGVLKNFAQFTGKHLCQRLFFNKVASLRSTTLLKKNHWHRCFPVNCAKFTRTAFVQKTSGRLLLNSANLTQFKRNSSFSSIFGSIWNTRSKNYKMT